MGIVEWPGLHDMTDEEFLGELAGRLWHTTTLKRFRGIESVGAILPDPPIPDEERWHTESGPEAYPYVRTLGGVSLFDFADFDPDTYNERYPFSTWREFVPFRDVIGHAVWLEVDRAKVADAYIDPLSLIKRWKHDGSNLRHIAMPEIEGAHIGALPITSLLRCLAISRPRRGRPPSTGGPLGGEG